MAETFTNWCIADLVKYNFGPRGKVPTFKLGPLVEPDLDTMLTALGTMYQPGTMPAEFTSYVVESTANLLDMPKDKVAAMVKAMSEAAQRTAQTPGQAAIAPTVGTVAAADQLVRGTPRGREAVATLTPARAS
jgi:hypothetical protein